MREHAGTTEATCEDLTSFSYHVYFNREYRFIFFSIPKVACTQWMQLFWRMEGVVDWQTDPHYRENRPLLSGIDRQLASEWLNDTSWTKAVFFRDPVERVVSAYLDKFQRDLPGHGRMSIPRRQFGDYGANISFPQFVDLILDENTNTKNFKGLHAGTDPHWRPQSLLCNMWKWLPNMDFVGNFVHLRSDARTLLQKVGIWNEYSSSGWGELGLDQMFEKSDAKNKTSAGKLVLEYCTPEILSRLEHAYQKDYEMMGKFGLERVGV